PTLPFDGMADDARLRPEDLPSSLGIRGQEFALPPQGTGVRANVRQQIVHLAAFEVGPCDAQLLRHFLHRRRMVPHRLRPPDGRIYAFDSGQIRSDAIAPSYRMTAHAPFLAVERFSFALIAGFIDVSGRIQK